MLRKHINDDTLFPVPVENRDDVVGPCPCPQEGCQPRDGDGPYRKGSVVVEEYGGNSGSYVTSYSCKCCDAKGELYAGEKPYRNYCFSFSARNLTTIYPAPFPMPRFIYEHPELIERVRRKSENRKEEKKEASESGCYIATAVYGSASHPAVSTLRRFRDGKLNTNKAGRFLVFFYYRLSPSLAQRIDSSSFLGRSIRKALDRFVSHLNSVS